MKKRILAYRDKIDRILEDDLPETNWNEIMEEHLIQIGFFQHERLIHLLVTLTFAILTFFAVGIEIITGYVYILALAAMLLVLLIPYIAHYYLLENEVQKMYVQYDKILEKQRLLTGK